MRTERELPRSRRLLPPVPDWPNRDRRVHAPRGKRSAVRREGDRDDRAAVPFQRGKFLAGGSIPEADLLVAAPRSQQRPVRGERDAVGPLPVRLPPAALLAGRNLPEREETAAAPGGVNPTGDRQGLAVGREGDR